MSWRTDLVERMPWVRKLSKPQPCQGIRWGEVPSKALYAWGPGRRNAPTGVEPYRCKKLGRWRFTALRKSRAAWPEPSAKSGVYCWAHLFSAGLYGSMRECERTTKWLDAQEDYPAAPEVES